MAPTSIAAAKTDLFNALATGAEGTPVSTISASVGKVYKGEPKSGDLLVTDKATVSIWTEAVDPTTFTFTLRVYQTTDADVIIAQDNFDAAVWAVERALTGEFERGDWNLGFDPELNLLTAEQSI